MLKLAIVSTLFLASLGALAQQTVYVAPAPAPGDPTYLSYQLGQLATALRRNGMEAARVDGWCARAERDRTIAGRLEISELETLISLAELLESADTKAQKVALRETVQAKLQELLPVSSQTWEADTVIVVATPGFDWAAEQVGGVLNARTVALDVGLYEARTIVREQPNVVGLVEVQVNVYQDYETVKALCYGSSGSLLWEKKRVLNFGGGPESLARKMVGALLKKV